MEGGDYMMSSIAIIYFYPLFLSGGGGGNSQIADLLSWAGELMTWLITQMGAIVTFALSNPITLIAIIVMFVSLAAGLLFRIVRSFSTR